MNIFVLDYDVRKCAEYTCDRHIVKMILESTQMLSTAVRLSGLEEGYKVSHQNHPCSKWCRDSLSNWLWLRDLVVYMNGEWRVRYDHDYDHKSYTVAMGLSVPDIEDKGLTKFALAMPEEYKFDDVVTSYRAYYKGEKSGFASWKNGIPDWWL